MAVYRLTNDLIFPNPELADSNGLLALDGDLSAKRLILAYSCGVFPWYSPGDPVLWWSPDPRCILFTNNLHISKSMNKFIRKNIYTVTFDAAFSDVIGMCRKLRSDDTWITDEMLNAYCSLNKSGLAHSVETWYEGSLVGGLYGVSLGRAFFGESMFSTMENASKVALISLASKVKERGFEFIDCQVYSKHLSSMGASNIPRKEFLLLLKKALRYDTLSGNWSSI